MRKGCVMIPTGELTSNLVCEGVPMFKVKLSERNVLLIKLDIVKGKLSHSALLSIRTQSDIENLHRRAGHPSNDSLKRMYNLPNFTINCEACSMSKSHRLPYQGSLPKSSHCLENIHFDLSGCINPPTSDGYKYYFKLTDHYSSHKFVYLLRRKSKALDCFKKFHRSVTTLHSRPIKSVTTDGGGEFNSIEFKEFLESNGISSNITAPYTPQQNPVAERGNRTTTEKARTLLKQANLPLQMWGYAVEAAVFLESFTPTKKSEWVSAYELWFFWPFNQSRLRPFGCWAFINLPKAKRQSKFSDTAQKGVMVGYQLGMHNWRILREDKKVELSHDVTFDKTLYPGISTLDPAGLQTPPTCLIEDFASNNEGPATDPSPDIPPFVDELDDSNTEVERRLLRSRSPPPAPSDSEESIPERNPGSSHPPRPGFDIVLQPVNQKAPQDISSSIDESNIVSHKRRAQLAMADNDWDFHVQCFHAGAQFFDQTSEAPKLFSKAMKAPTLRAGRKRSTRNWGLWTGCLFGRLWTSPRVKSCSTQFGYSG
jgi:transposase InsO family protein